MKHRSLLLVLGVVFLIVSGLMFAALPQRVILAQNETTDRQDSEAEPVVTQAANFAVTRALSDMEVLPEPTDSFRFANAGSNVERPASAPQLLSGEADSPQSLKESNQIAAPVPNAAVPSSNFEGISSQNNANVLGSFLLPPDTVGDVGSTQYVQAVNLLFQVYDKTTGAALTTARPISDLFTALPATSRCRRRDDGDPIVLYDSLADRWFISQFVARDASSTPPSNPPFAQCIAVSQTGDATGAYFVYEFTSPNDKFGDYPKYGVWTDAYYSTTRQFFLNASGQNEFREVGVYAYDRAKMLRGDPTATYIYFDLENRYPDQFTRNMLPSDADGILPPPAGAPNIFSYYNANEELDEETDSLRLFEFHADFANPSASTFTERADSPLAVAAFDAITPSGRDDIEQPRPAPATAFLDSIGDRLMHRLQYRNFGTFEALTVNHTVNAGTRRPEFFPNVTEYRAAPRYYQLRRDTPGGNFTIQNQGTFALDDAVERWMGSAALDNQGNLALGYSASDRTNTYPSIRYTGRLATDPRDVLHSEQTIRVGTGVQTNDQSRWGDYSSMNVDPVDDCTFFYTQQYYRTTDRTPATAPFGLNWQTRIASFKFPTCIAPPQGRLNVTAASCATNALIQGAIVVIDGNLYGATSPGGAYAANLMPGTYTVTISAPGLSSITRTVTIADGVTASIDVCLGSSQ